MVSVDSRRKARIASRDLAADVVARVLQQIFGDLLGDRRSARRAAAGRPLLRRIIEDRADQAREVDPVMREEVLVLGRDEGVDDERRIFVIGQLDPALAGEGLDRRAVIAADVGRQRRLVGEQRLRRRQAAREIDPHRGEQGEQRERRPRSTRRTHRACPPRVDALVHPLVEGDEVGQRPVGDVQALELHSAQASSLFGGKRGKRVNVARARRDVGFDRLGERKHDPGALLGIAQQQFVVGIADDSRLRTAPRALPARRRTWKAAKRCGFGPQLEPAGGFADQPRGKVGRRAHLRAHREIGENRRRPTPLARSSVAVAVLARREARGFRVRGDVGQRIDARAARQRVGRAVDMERNEHRGVEPPGDGGALVERQIAVVVAGHRDAHPARVRPARREARGRAPGSAPFRATWPETLVAPGSRPPWPASITTIGRPARRRRRRRCGRWPAAGRSTVRLGLARVADRGRATASSDAHRGRRATASRNAGQRAAPSPVPRHRSAKSLNPNLVSAQPMYHANMVNGEMYRRFRASDACAGCGGRTRDANRNSISGLPPENHAAASAMDRGSTRLTLE